MNRLFLSFVIYTLFVISLAHPRAQELRIDSRVSIDASDVPACTRNLGLIFEAIQEYQSRNQKLPDKLSDLVPQFIHDRQILVCPIVQKTGDLKSWRSTIRDLAADPRTSYSYEFPPTQLGDDLWRGLPTRTWRDLKEVQKQKVGGVVPIVRCLAHRPILNLAFEGQIYGSQLYWEERNPAGSFDAESLQAHKLFADRAVVRPVSWADVPPRSTHADKTLVDLTRHYNALLSDSWQGFPNNHLGQLPSGVQHFAGVFFDVRGVIQLGGAELPIDFPQSVEAMPVHQKAKRIHFLHGTAYEWHSKPATNVIANYYVHFTDGQRLALPIIYGKDVADWWFDPGKPFEPSHAKVAWSGTNPAAQVYGKSIHLYRMEWVNPSSEVEIESISAVSARTISAPFLLAITIEP